jgi:hypothetical protein
MLWLQPLFQSTHLPNAESCVLHPELLGGRHKFQNVTSKKTCIDATQRHSDLKLVGCLWVTVLCIQNCFFAENLSRSVQENLWFFTLRAITKNINPYPTAFPYGNGKVLHFYQQQERSTTKTVNKVINKRLKTYV